MINLLTVYREGAISTAFPIDESTIFNEKLPGTRLVTCPVTSSVILPVQEGDYIVWKNEGYIINILPDYDKDSESDGIKYNMVFEAQFYQFLDEFILNSLGLPDFPYYGTARDHLLLILANANRDSSGWVLGTVDVTESKNIDYSWTYIRPGLDIIAEAFGLEYQVVGKTINMIATIGRDTMLVFELGRSKGLHQIKRSPDASKSVINRVYAVGGTQNITAAYRGGTETNLIIEGRYIQSDGVANGTERVKEGKYENLDIYPRFEGSITATTVLYNTDGTVNYVTITDPTIDFDLMAQLQPDVKAKASFRTGQLAGVQFEISAFDLPTKTITLINNTDSNGTILPNLLSLPAIGDKFTFLDIIMPAAYVTRAEAELLAAATIFLNDNKLQRLLFEATPDEKFLRDNNIQLKVGDRANVIEPDINLNEILRFTEISYPLVNEFKVKAVIGGDIKYDRVVKLFADVNQAHQLIQAVDRRSEELAKRGVKDLRIFEAAVFNPDGKFDTDKLNIGVLTFSLGIIGTKSQDFRLNLVFITDNYQGDANSVAISAGELIHREISNPGDQNVWQLESIVQHNMVADKLYYVYCKCSTTAQVGTYVITQDQIKYDGVAGYYMFLTGMITPVIDGYRNSDFTNGIADINPNRLKIGKVLSRDGLTGFDLDNSTIFGKITFRNTAGTLTDVNTVNNTATLAQSNALAAQTLATTANAELADIASDAKLTPNEKTIESRRLAEINQAYPVRIQEAAPYGVNTTAYTAAYNALFTYINSNNLLYDMNATSDIVANDFQAAFNNYYAANVNLTKAISDATNTKIGAINVGTNWSAGKMLYKDPEFTGANGQNGFNGIATYNNAGGTDLTIGRGVGYSDFINGGLPANPNSSGCYLGISYHGAGVVSPGFGGFYFGNQSRANAKFITRIVALIPIGKAINFSSNAYGDNGFATWNTPQLGTGKWEEYIITVQCGATGTFSSTNFFYIGTTVADNPAFSWYVSYASVFDMTASEIDYAKDYSARDIAAINTANSYADSVAIAKANIAQAYAISQASTDATNKSTTAYNNSVAVSNTYAATVANSASSAAQVAAAADASNKAQTAFNNAEANRITQFNSLTSALGPLAYQGFVALSQLDATIVDNGRIRTTLLEAQGIWTNILNAGIVNTQQLFSTSGTIGGFTITPTNLSGTNGGTSIELNVTSPNPFIQISAGAVSTLINYRGLSTSVAVVDDIKVNRALFLSCQHVFMKTGTGSNGEDVYGGRVGDYGSNGNALVEQNGSNTTVNAYDVNASHFMTGNTVRYNTLTQLSDIRFKKTIKPLKYGLKQVLKLKPITFKYKLPKSDQIQADNITHIGLSAQDVKEVMPELVMDGERLSVSMVELMPVMINAIKELQQQITQLKNK